MKKQDSDTKQKIVDAAYKVLAEQGYDKTSMKQIAKEAGVAQGLINYYFESKEDLLFALFHEESCRYSEELSKLSDIPMSQKFIQEALQVPKKLVLDQPEWHRLRFELFAIGLRSERGAQEITRSSKMDREQTINELSRLHITEDHNIQGLARIITAVMDGLSLQMMVDPEFEADLAYETFAKMLETYLTKKE
ncbi:TetR/AcrR family transcriptional regulator [Chengkuizengella axinellae]|uniref:TetR/AcrR family transcriptional regulator n=1 Tax=Chengkuizengella axinellae TaxID=3064388 RepID=A0ABT9J3W3_9BACL|nr:TetR/AcrR family transcriptional regulator [Chengkuizengella sp. 2205SS18-9]MDP5276258.1 TetR/AcrR family transcriptional regulator [Chengkuizengella sp. 2205SS18-9]